MSDWTKHVTQHYKTERAKDPKYMFKHALKDAAKTYKKGAKAEPLPEAKPQKKNKRARTMKKKPRK
jgi:hypothetical protein